MSPCLDQANACAKVDRGAAAKPWNSLLVAGLTGVIACGGDQPIHPGEPRPTERPLSEVVTGPAAASDNGRFVLPQPSNGGRGEIDAKQAEAFALAWRSSFGQWARGFLTKKRGGHAVDIDHLVICRQTLYAQSSFEAPPLELFDNPAAGFIIRRFGPQWLVSLCSPAGEFQVLLALPAYAHGMSIVDGKLSVEPIGGEWFTAEGVPPGARDELPTPEAAARAAAAASGRKVTEIPQLLVPTPSEGLATRPRWPA